MNINKFFARKVAVVLALLVALTAVQSVAAVTGLTTNTPTFSSALPVTVSAHSHYTGNGTSKYTMTVRVLKDGSVIGSKTFTGTGSVDGTASAGCAAGSHSYVNQTQVWVSLPSGGVTNIGTQNSGSVSRTC